MADPEERFAFFQRDSSLILVVAVGQLAAQVQFHLAAVFQGDCSNIVGRFEVLVRVRYPAQVPAAITRQRQRQGTDRRCNGQAAPRFFGLGANQRHDGLGTRQVAGHIPDLQHRFVLEGMERMRITPLLKRLAFLLGAVIGVQTHTPMRGGIGDGIVFSFRERVVGHWPFLVSCILTLGGVCENISHGI
ncbi:hypothetical protein D3C84_478010 [compost metagenome]